MLEVLFARAQQGQTFLRLCVLGLLAGALLHASVGVHRRSAWAGHVWDAVCCAVVGVLAAVTLALSGAGVRLYGVLGLLVGVMLYAWGLRVVVNGVGRRLRAWKKKSDRR